MKSKLLKSSLLFLFITGAITLAYSWGHKHISRAAVFALPEPMQKFFYNHIDYITEAAVVPDIRRAIINDKNESNRHFIDIEDFKIPIGDFRYFNIFLPSPPQKKH
jgi:hypothetical protein